MAKVDETGTDYLQQPEELAHFAQSWELETKNKNLGKEMVGAVGELRRTETRRCHEYGQVGHLRVACPGTQEGGAADITLAVNEVNMAAEKVWILDSGSSRHLVNDASWLEDVEPYVDACVQPNGDALNITKKGTLTLKVTACGKQQTMKLADMYYAENVVHNLISYGTLDRKGFALTERGGRRVVAGRNGGRQADEERQTEEGHGQQLAHRPCWRSDMLELERADDSVRPPEQQWRVPAKRGDVLNAYVKARKEAELATYIRIPQGMAIPDEILKQLGVTSDDELVLELEKALYGLKQAGRLWNKLLHSKLVEIGFVQSLTDMCVYSRRQGGVLLVVGVYVDDLLVTGLGASEQVSRDARELQRRGRVRSGPGNSDPGHAEGARDGVRARFPITGREFDVGRALHAARHRVRSAQGIEAHARPHCDRLEAGQECTEVPERDEGAAAPNARRQRNGRAAGSGRVQRRGLRGCQRGPEVRHGRAGHDGRNAHQLDLQEARRDVLVDDGGGVYGRVSDGHGALGCARTARGVGREARGAHDGARRQSGCSQAAGGRGCVREGEAHRCAYQARRRLHEERSPEAGVSRRRKHAGGFDDQGGRGPKTGHPVGNC
ncbi:hypothetical protein ON010_g4154 [Phytophthora cinnamomi]|nr:hypothetical protein ON010_g4154 [Phytophthora cinnamomi]